MGRQQDDIRRKKLHQSHVTHPTSHTSQHIPLIQHHLVTRHLLNLSSGISTLEDGSQALHARTGEVA